MTEIEVIRKRTFKVGSPITFWGMNGRTKGNVEKIISKNKVKVVFVNKHYNCDDRETINLNQIII